MHFGITFTGLSRRRDKTHCLTYRKGNCRTTRNTGIIWRGGGLFNFNEGTLYPETDRYNLNLTANYDLAPGFNAYVEAKYVLAESREVISQDSFYDTLFTQPDNPFIPAELQPVVAQTGGLAGRIIFS